MKLKKLAYFLIYILLLIPFSVRAQFAESAPASDSLGIRMIGFFESIVYIFLGAIGVISIIGLLIAAVLYATAGGDDDRVGQSGRTIGYSIVGIIICIMGIYLLDYLNNYLGTQGYLLG